MSYRRQSGIGHTPAYQVSGIPYLTGSLTVPASSGTPLEVAFPMVTMDVVIKNTAVSGSPDLRFGISSAGVRGVVNNNYLTLTAGESFSMRWKVAKLYLLSDTTSPTSASVGAALTGIPKAALLKDPPSGSTIGSVHADDPEAIVLGQNWSGSVGVG